MDNRYESRRPNQRKRALNEEKEKISFQPRFTDVDRKREDAAENHTRGGF